MDARELARRRVPKSEVTLIRSSRSATVSAPTSSCVSRRCSVCRGHRDLRSGVLERGSEHRADRVGDRLAEEGRDSVPNLFRNLASIVAEELERVVVRLESRSLPRR